MKYFVTEKIITTNEQEKITSTITKPERVIKLLLNISGPLDSGDTKAFYTMLMIMKTYGVSATQCLANQIIAKVDKSKLPELVNTAHMNNSIPED